MFLGMSFCLPIGWAYEYMQRPKESSEKQPDTEPLLSTEQVGLRLPTARPYIACLTNACGSAPCF